MSARARVAAACAFAAFGAAGTALADEPATVAGAAETAAAAASAPATVESWSKGLGSPAREDALSGLPAFPRMLDAADALAAVKALTEAGGYGAAEALRPFLTHRETAVRVAALRATGVVGIRLRPLVADLRQALEDREPAVRVAAWGALGRVGDGHDVPGLLDALESDDLETRSVALRSLHSITGVRLTASVVRWDRWWRLSTSTAPTRLYAALTGIASGMSADVATDRETVARYAWADVDSVEDAARAWLRSSDPRLRTEGSRTTAALRLGSLAHDVRSIARYTSDPAVFTAAREAAEAIGLSLAGIKPPSGVK
jgi:hypothetical protein